MRPNRLTILLPALFALVLLGCSGDDETTTQSSEPDAAQDGNSGLQDVEAEARSAAVEFFRHRRHSTTTLHWSARAVPLQPGSSGHGRSTASTRCRARPTRCDPPRR
ncbi:MAG: hypothetical protein R2716_04785 [Microthrixaceae bacterium]